MSSAAKQEAIAEIMHLCGEFEALAAALQPVPGEREVIPVPIELAARMAEMLLLSAQALKGVCEKIPEEGFAA